MALASMTGFARTEGVSGPWSWHWEAKSVNGRSLELRCRLPTGFEALERDLRPRLQKHFSRGNIQVQLHVETEAADIELQLNRQALEAVYNALAELRTREKLPPPDPAVILSLRGVLEPKPVVQDSEVQEARDKAILATADALLLELKNARLEEGRALETALTAQLDAMDKLVAEAEAQIALLPDLLRERIMEQIALVLENIRSQTSLSEDRLAQELALVVAKSDVREEVDRLRAHVCAARDLMTKKEAVGRKLDFLSQEFNREANTLCSKAANIELKNIGLELKTVIDQFREQVQNIE